METAILEDHLGGGGAYCNAHSMCHCLHGRGEGYDDKVSLIKCIKFIYICYTVIVPIYCRADIEGLIDIYHLYDVLP